MFVILTSLIIEESSWKQHKVVLLHIIIFGKDKIWKSSVIFQIKMHCTWHNELCKKVETKGTHLLKTSWLNKLGKMEIKNEWGDLQSEWTTAAWGIFKKAKEVPLYKVASLYFIVRPCYSVCSFITLKLYIGHNDVEVVQYITQEHLKNEWESRFTVGKQQNHYFAHNAQK